MCKIPVRPASILACMPFCAHHTPLTSFRPHSLCLDSETRREIHFGGVGKGGEEVGVPSPKGVTQVTGAKIGQFRRFPRRLPGQQALGGGWLDRNVWHLDHGGARTSGCLDEGGSCVTVALAYGWTCCKGDAWESGASTRAVHDNAKSDRPELARLELALRTWGIGPR